MLTENNSSLTYKKIVQQQGKTGLSIFYTFYENVQVVGENKKNLLSLKSVSSYFDNKIQIKYQIN